MSRQVLVISTSPRKGGNSDTPAYEFVRGAQEDGTNVENIDREDADIRLRQRCFACNVTRGLL